MNNKIIIGVATLVVAIIGFILLSNNKYSRSSRLQPLSTITSSPTKEITTEQNLITLTPDGFSPATLTIKERTKVTWINKSGSQATVNSNPHPTHTSYSPLNLGNFFEGSTLSLTFDKPGTYRYHNHLNPSQSGTIIVE